MPTLNGSSKATYSLADYRGTTQHYNYCKRHICVITIHKLAQHYRTYRHCGKYLGPFICIRYIADYPNIFTIFGHQICGLAEPMQLGLLSCGCIKVRGLRKNYLCHFYSQISLALRLYSAEYIVAKSIKDCKDLHLNYNCSTQRHNLQAMGRCKSLPCFLSYPILQTSHIIRACVRLVIEHGNQVRTGLGRFRPYVASLTVFIL